MQCAWCGYLGSDSVLGTRSVETRWRTFCSSTRRSSFWYCRDSTTCFSTSILLSTASCLSVRSWRPVRIRHAHASTLENRTGDVKRRNNRSAQPVETGHATDALLLHLSTPGVSGEKAKAGIVRTTACIQRQQSTVRRVMPRCEEKPEPAERTLPSHVFHAHEPGPPVTCREEAADRVGQDRNSALPIQCSKPWGKQGSSVEPAILGLKALESKCLKRNLFAQR